MLNKKLILRKNETAHVMSERSALTRVLRHPYIVTLHYAFTTSSKIFFVLDYINGGEVRKPKFCQSFLKKMLIITILKSREISGQRKFISKEGSKFFFYYSQTTTIISLKIVATCSLKVNKSKKIEYGLL